MPDAKRDKKPRRGQSLQDKVAVYRFRKSMAVKRPVGHHRSLRKLNE